MNVHAVNANVNLNKINKVLTQMYVLTIFAHIVARTFVDLK